MSEMHKVTAHLALCLADPRKNSENLDPRVRDRPPGVVAVAPSHPFPCPGVGRVGTRSMKI